jgi:hypothetical protein
MRNICIYAQDKNHLGIYTYKNYILFNFFSLPFYIYVDVHKCFLFELVTM